MVSKFKTVPSRNQILLCAILVGGFSLLPSSFAQPNAAQIEGQLKNTLAGLEPKFALSPWQKNLFREEVIPQYQRFIKDYRASGKDLSVEVDEESLKDFLEFYAPEALKNLGVGQDVKMLVYLETQSTCQKCADGRNALLQLFRSRLAHRGITPIWLSRRDLDGEVSASNLPLQLQTMAQKRSATGYMILGWDASPTDDDDTAHADEAHYFIRVEMNLANNHLIHEQKDLLDSDRFDLVGGRLLTDSFNELGRKHRTGSTKLSDSASLEKLNPNSEIWININGIQDFSQYVRVKNQLAGQFKDLGSLEERKISRGQVVFALFSNRSKEEVKKMLSAVRIDPSSRPALSVEVE